MVHLRRWKHGQAGTCYLRDSESLGCGVENGRGLEALGESSDLRRTEDEAQRREESGFLVRAFRTLVVSDE